MGEVGMQSRSTLAKAFAAAARLLREAGIATPSSMRGCFFVAPPAISQEALVADPARPLSADAQTPVWRMDRAPSRGRARVAHLRRAASSTAAPSSSMPTRSIRGPTPRRWSTRRLRSPPEAGAGGRSACSISARARAAFSSRCSPSCQGPPVSAPISARRRCRSRGPMRGASGWTIAPTSLPAIGSSRSPGRSISSSPTRLTSRPRRSAGSRARWRCTTRAGLGRRGGRARCLSAHRRKAPRRGLPPAARSCWRSGRARRKGCSPSSGGRAANARRASLWHDLAGRARVVGAWA